jgi:hypothetical protein
MGCGVERRKILPELGVIALRVLSAKILRLMDSRKESPIVILMHALPPAVIGAMALQIAVAIGLTMAGFLAAGLFADTRLGTRPLFTLLLTFVSLLVSMGLTYRIALRTSARARDAYQAYLDGQHAASRDAACAAAQQAQPQSAQPSNPPARALPYDHP